jgi:hypothetical protein
VKSPLASTGFLFVALTLSLTSCDRNDQTGNDSAASASISSLFRKLPEPRPQSGNDLARVFKETLTLVSKSMREASTHSAADALSGRTALGVSLLKALSSTSDGLPRWQIKPIILSLVDAESIACAGVSCGRIFGLQKDEVEGFLDEIYKIATDGKKLDKLGLKASQDKLMASLMPRTPAHKKGRPNQPVKFQNINVELAAGKALGTREITYGKLESITKLSVRSTSPDETDDLVDLSELSLFPNLKSLSVGVMHPDQIKEVAKHAHLVDELGIELGIDDFASTIKVQHLEPLSGLMHLKKVSLDEVVLDRPDLIPQYFSHVKTLALKNVSRAPERVNDALMRELSQIPNLRSLELSVRDAKDMARLTHSLPRSVMDVKVVLAGKKSGRDCKGLQMFGAFRNASSFTVTHCMLSALGPFGGPIDWKQLKLEAPTSALNPGQPLVLKLHPDLRQLMVFSSSTDAVRLDDVSRHELVVRLAQNQNRPD